MQIFRSLDYSFNKIKVIENLTENVQLEELFFAANKISQIEGLPIFFNY